MSRYYTGPVMQIPHYEQKLTANNEWTRRRPYEVCVDYHNTTIIRVFVQEDVVHLTTGGYDTVSTVTHMNAALKRLSDEFSWMYPASVYRQRGITHFHALEKPSRDTVYRLRGVWGVRHG